MIIRINFQSGIPLYEQLKIAIIEGIGTGKLAPGEALPSVRQLGSDLGINLHTVNKAYTVLKDEGYISVHRKKGVVVNPQAPAGDTTVFRTGLRGRLYPLVVEAYTRKIKARDFCALCAEIYQDLLKKKTTKE